MRESTGLNSLPRDLVLAASRDTGTKYSYNRNDEFLHLCEMVFLPGPLTYTQTDIPNTKYKDEL